eukprot:CAMPEP_0113525264 /NCGR_PEP_ID=MMETSP0015_2-20120614/60_1 /TAXON_ID=2838 /ORGANISM="Odontella" /LENGTH=215 /DNA_ID=CAMNT_0000423401 /DNA_START=2603 /DNA_END=3250 /DNA_ORIENTATION=- /assembly_acc=CAM_ASM_000160
MLLAEGVHLMIPFQCHLCHFWNLEGRDLGFIPTDTAYLIHTRRAIIDASWEREPKTIEKNVGEVRRKIKKCLEAGKTPSYVNKGPFPCRDVVGMGPDVDMILRSLDSGHHGKYVQFDTFRNSRSAYYSVYRASAVGILEGASIGDDPMKKITLMWCLTQNLWFERFKVPGPVIKAIHRWEKVEAAKGTRTRFDMMSHYADVVVMLTTILQYSGPL